MLIQQNNNIIICGIVPIIATVLLLLGVAANNGGMQQHDFAARNIDDLSHAGFEYFEAITTDSQRAATTLAADCANINCGQHGQCIKGSCICDAEQLLGYWAGSECNECAVGWAGVDCTIECQGGSCNQCNGNGKCNEGISGDGACTCFQDPNGYYDGPDCGTCKSGYFGEKCDKSCPGADQGAQACWGRGDCISGGAGAGTCACIEGYGTASGCQECDEMSYGPNCEKKCDGFNPVTYTPCSGHGKCNSGTAGDGTCICEPTYGTFTCQRRCPSVDSSRCSGHGICFDNATGNATCKCQLNFGPPDCAVCVANRVGDDCMLECPETTPTATEPPRVCSDRGLCTRHPITGGAECMCSAGYTSEAASGSGQDICELPCPGNPPCSGHGSCHKDTSGLGLPPTCECFQNNVTGFWAGAVCDRCDTRFNQSQSANCTVKCPVNSITGDICSGNSKGYCAMGKCYCNRGVEAVDYCGVACETSSPPGFKDNGVEAACTLVYCALPDHFGPDCLECPGRTTTDPIVPCNGNGRCDEGKQGTGTCSCYTGFAGPTCDRTCPYSFSQSCGGGGRGNCNHTVDQYGTVTVFCDCIYGFAGRACELACPQVAGAVCADHGYCSSGHLGNAKCTCFLGWTGKSCNVPCTCDTAHGNCDHDYCANYPATKVCDTCLCEGNFTNLCDMCKPGYQGVNCEGQCINGETIGRKCNCSEPYATASCGKLCPHAVGPDGFTRNGPICANRGTCEWGNDKLGVCVCETYGNGVPKYYGPACEVECSVDMCRQTLMTPQCNPATGACECKDDETGHWTGDYCSECLEGFFGAQCVAACQCSGHGGCDKTTGDCQCFQSFHRGFYSGSACDVCTDGFIGDGCERSNVRYTRINQDVTVNDRYEIAPHEVPKRVPATQVLMIDERLDTMYGGAYPALMLNASLRNAGNISQRFASKTTAFKEGVFRLTNGNTSMVDCYDEVAHTMVDKDFLYVLMQPQMQCNLTARLLRRARLMPPNPAVNQMDFRDTTVFTKIWQMPHPDYWAACSGCAIWGNRTSRITSAHSLSETKRLGSEVIDSVSPTLAFIIGRTDPNDFGIIASGGLLVRISIDVLTAPEPEKAAAAALLPFSLRPLKVRTRPGQVGVEQSEAILVSGKRISETAGNTWEILLFYASESIFIPDPYTNWEQAGFRNKLDCWPVPSDKTKATPKCIECDSVPSLDWYVSTSPTGDQIRSIAAAIDTPDTAGVAWLRPFQDVWANNDPFFHRFGLDVASATCHPAYIVTDLAGTPIIRSKTTGETSTFARPEFVAFFADSKVNGAQTMALVVDQSTAVVHTNILVIQKQSYMVKYIMKSPFSILGIVPLSVMSALTKDQVQKTEPEVFTNLVIDEHARILYGTVAAQVEFRVASYLLYDVMSLNPSLADQRGGTVVQVVGHGFKPIIDSLNRAVETRLYPIMCRFAGLDSVPANFLSDTLLNCTTLKVSEEAAVSSCEGQSVEVTMYGDKFFTDNRVPLRRVQAAQIFSRAMPDRGGLSGGQVVIFTGTGFVDSPFGRCKFFSNNTVGVPKETLYSPLQYINVSAARCVQPRASVPSPQFAFLDVSLDGQLFIDVSQGRDPPFYTIVGSAANISSPSRVSEKAIRGYTIFSVATRLVDELQAWVGNLDDTTRTVCVDRKGIEAVQCDPERFTWRGKAGTDEYPSPPCRENVLKLLGNASTYIETPAQFCRTVFPKTGEVVWGDMAFKDARTGSFSYRFRSRNRVPGFSVEQEWFSVVELLVMPGNGYALEINNRLAILERATFPPSQSFAPIPEIIVIDENANVLDNPRDTLVVTCRAYYLWDTNRTNGGNSTWEVKIRSDENKVRFPAILPTFVHGAYHYFEFTANSVPGHRDLKPTTSPPLRTVLCPNPDRSYKIPFSSECGVCPPAGAVCNGTEMIIVLPGYWRGNSTTDIYPCPAGPEVCRGSEGAAEGANCSEGYTGPLCALCKPEWGKAGATSCQPCPPLETSAGLIVLTVFILICGLTGWTITTIRKAEVTDLSVVMRTVVNHMQASGKLAEFSGPKWDSTSKGAMDAQNSASGLSFSGLSSVSCVISMTGGDYMTVFLGYMVLPCISFIMAGLVLCTVRVLKLKPVLTEKVHAQIIEEVKNMPSARIGLILEQYPWYWVLVTTFSLMFFVLYQTLITQATIVLKCVEMVIAPGKKQQYLEIDMSIPCTSDGDHKFKSYAYVGAIGYGFGIPSAFVATYKFMMNSIGNPDLVNQMFMFMIGGYKPEFWFWQAIIMVRKLVLVLVITFVGDNPQLQSYGGMWTMSMALVLQIWMQPNDREQFNRVETLSLAVITLTLNLGLLFFWHERPPQVTQLLSAVMVLITIGVFVMFGYFVYEPIRVMAQQQLDKAKEIIAKLKAPKEEVVVEEEKKMDKEIVYDDTYGPRDATSKANKFSREPRALAASHFTELDAVHSNNHNDVSAVSAAGIDDDDVLGLSVPRAAPAKSGASRPAGKPTASAAAAAPAKAKAPTTMAQLLAGNDMFDDL